MRTTLHTIILLGLCVLGGVAWASPGLDPLMPESIFAASPEHGVGLTLPAVTPHSSVISIRTTGAHPTGDAITNRNAARGSLDDEYTATASPLAGVALRRSPVQLE